MGWPRRLLLRLLLRLLGPVTGTDTERVLAAGACPRCGTWRCPDCWWLILLPVDHHIACRRANHPNYGGE